MVADAAKDAAPTKSNPTPSGIFALERASMAPSTRKAAPTIPAITSMLSLINLVMVSQLTATTAAKDAAPAIIMPIPSGMFALVITRIMPRASKAPATIVTITASDPCKVSAIRPQFSEAAPYTANAPATIRAMPIGIFAPEKVNTAPNARRAIPVNKVATAANPLLTVLVKSGAIPPLALAPPELSESPFIVFSSSKGAKYLLAFFAAEPTPSIAFCWS